MKSATQKQPMDERGSDALDAYQSTCGGCIPTKQHSFSVDPSAGRKTMAATSAASSTSSTMRASQELLWNKMQGKLLGREEEENRLMDCFHRCCGGTNQQVHREIVLITGAAGTGKTALAKRLADKATLLMGKCQEDSQKQQPLAAFAQAWNKVLRRRIHKTYFHRRVVKAIKAATNDSDPEDLLNLLPALRLYLRSRDQINSFDGDEDGENLRVSNLFEAFQSTMDRRQKMKKSTFFQQGTLGASNPTAEVFCRFLKHFCSKQDPVVLLIDDWQWMDASSLQLMEQIALIEETIEGFMLVGTCRGNEVDPDSDLSRSLRSLESEGVHITDIQMQPFHEASVTRCAAYLFLDNDDDSAEIKKTTTELEQLSKFVHQRTQGNPFLVVETFQSLVELELIQLRNGVWSWDSEFLKVSSIEIGNASMLEATIQRLSKESALIENFLCIASCLNNEFETSYIRKLGEMSSEEFHCSLRILIQRGILVQIEHLSQTRVSFSHDRWREAAFSLIGREGADDFRFWVGRQMMKHLSAKELTENAFLVAHLLVGKALHAMEDPQERINTSELFGLAGSKAAQCSAFEVAAAYFNDAIQLLPEKGRWEGSMYPLCLQLHNFAVEMAFCLGRSPEVDRIVDEILQHTTEFEDQLRAYETKSHSLASRHKFAESCDVAFQIMRLLGFPLPKKFGPVRIMKDIVLLLWYQRTIKEENVLKLKQMTDWRALAAMSTLKYLGQSLPRYKPEASLSSVIAGLQITFKHGIASTSCLSFAGVGIVLSNFLGMIDESEKFVRIAERMYEQVPASKFVKARMVLVCDFIIGLWRLPIRSILPKLLKGGDAGMMTGDIEIAGLCYAHCANRKVFAGYPLDGQYEEAESQRKRFTSLGQESIVLFFVPLVDLLANLTGRQNLPDVLTPDSMAHLERSRGQTADAHASIMGGAFLFREFWSILNNDWTRAVKYAEEIEQMNTIAFDGFYNQHMTFLGGLSMAVLAREYSHHGSTKKKEARKLKAKASKALNKLKKVSAFPRKEGAWYNKVVMLEAELLAYRNERDVALVKWSASIQDALRQDMIHEAALAYERMGRTLVEWGDIKEAINSFREAKSLYSQWQCPPKVEDMSVCLAELSSVSRSLCTSRISSR